MRSYSLANVVRAHQWLAHQPSFTEVCVIHPEYRPGDTAWNQSHNAELLSPYITRSNELAALVREYATTRLVCYGYNPRPSILTNAEGQPRPALHEHDIAVSQTFPVDLDLHGTITKQRLQHLKKFLDKPDEHLTSVGINAPVRAATGRGYHLLFAYPPITVAECPDIRDRVRAFTLEFALAHQHELRRLEVRLDFSQPLRHLVRAYGTTQPGTRIRSHFCGPSQRKPDHALREYLLTRTTPVPVVPKREWFLPEWFIDLLLTDSTLKGLWHGTGLPQGADPSTSASDHRIATYLATRGLAYHDTITSILTLRPAGAEERSKQGMEHLKRIVTSALSRHNGNYPH